MVSIAVQPPTETEIMRYLWPPVVAMTRVSIGGHYDNTNLFASAVLLGSNGTMTNARLNGSLVASGHPLEDGRSSRETVAFAFPDLSLASPGSFIIRVDVYRVDYGSPQGAVLIDRAHTEPFWAVDQAVHEQRPCKYCIQSKPLNCHASTS